MNLPNKLTVLRVIMVVPFIVFLMGNTHITGTYDKWIALAIFVIASLTDLLDGYIARKYNMVTDFGKFMDPLADKLLVCLAMICFVELNKLPAWMVVIIIAREFVISGIRLVAAEKGTVIAASYYGKFKTAFSMVMIILLIMDINIPVIQMVTQVFIWISFILTVVSLIDYIIKNKSVFEGTMR